MKIMSEQLVSARVVKVEVELPDLPVGYRLETVMSEYYGSHEERGDGDKDVYFGVPVGQEWNRPNLQHGSHGDHWREALTPLVGTGVMVLEWEEEKTWVPLTQEIVEQMSA